MNRMKLRSLLRDRRVIAAAACILLCLVLLILYLTVFSGMGQTTDDPTSNATALHPAYERRAVRQIRLHNSEGDFGFVRQNGGEAGAPFVLLLDGQERPLYTTSEQTLLGKSTLLPARISALFTTVCDTLVYESYDTPTEEQRAAYGLSEAQDPAWFEVTLLSGGSYRIYGGDRTVADDGYYIRYDDGTDAHRDKVYRTADYEVSAYNLTVSVSAVFRPAAYYVVPDLTATFSTAGNYYVDRFVALRYTDGSAPITGADTVYYKYYESVDGAPGETRTASLSMRAAGRELYAALLGKTRGPVDIVYETGAGEDRVETHIVEILAVASPHIGFSYRYNKDRSDYYGGISYTLEAPGSLVSYAPDTNYIFDILEQLENLQGSETVAIGTDNAIFDRYGFRGEGAFQISYRIPMMYASQCSVEMLQAALVSAFGLPQERSFTSLTSTDMTFDYATVVRALDNLRLESLVYSDFLADEASVSVTRAILNRALWLCAGSDATDAEKADVRSRLRGALDVLGGDHSALLYTDEAPFMTVSFTLLVSPADEAGGRYVAGSMLGTVVYLEDASVFSFTDADHYDWVNKDLLLAWLVRTSPSAKLDRRIVAGVRSIVFERRAGGESIVNRFDLVHSKVAGDSSSRVETKVYSGGVEYQGFSYLYQYLISIPYTDESSLTESEREALCADEGRLATQITLTYEELSVAGYNKFTGSFDPAPEMVETTHTYRFFYINERQVLVEVDGSAEFCISTRSLESLQIKLGQLLAGETVNPEEEY